MNGPVFLTGPGGIQSAEHPFRTQDGLTAEQTIQRFVELAVAQCGSAAALARNLKVRPPTVSQWRAGRKRPDAVKLIRIQELARKPAGH